MRHDAQDPQQAAVREDRLAEGAQVLGVVVEGLLARERLEVAVHVKQDEPDEHQPGPGHEDLEGDGGAAGRRGTRWSCRCGHEPQPNDGRRVGEIRRTLPTCDIPPVTCRYAGPASGCRGRRSHSGQRLEPCNRPAGRRSSRAGGRGPAGSCPCPGVPLMSEVFIAYCRIAKPIASLLTSSALQVDVARCRRPGGSRGRTAWPAVPPQMRGLLGGLDPLGAGEQATGRDAGRDERPVVGPAAEVGALERQLPLGVEGLEGLLDAGRAARARARRRWRRSRRRRRRRRRGSASRPCRS